MSETVTFVVAGAYGGGNDKPDEFAAWLDRIGTDVGLLCEVDGRGRGGGRLQHELRKLGALYTGTKTHGAREVGVWLRDRRPVQDTCIPLTRFVSRPFAHDRWTERVQRGNNVTYAVHANAVIQKHDGGWTSNVGAVVWRERGIPALGNLLRDDIDAGHGVTVGGDTNATKSDTRPGPSPSHLFDRLRMEYVEHGLMWFAFTPDHYRLVDSVVLPKAPGTDAHKVLKVRLAPKEKL